MSWWKIWKSGTRKYAFIQAYVDENKEKIPGIRHIDQLNFTVLDTETSGLDPAKDTILSFGAVKIQQSKIRVDQSVEWYPNSENSGSKTVAIHELVAVKHTLTKEEFSRKFLSYVGNSIIVGHHIGFDLEILKSQLKPFGFNQFKNPVIDTYHLAIRLEKGPLIDFNSIKQDEYSLDSLCKRYGIDLDDRHTAAGDAFLTALLMLKLLVKAKSKGITTFKSLLHFH